MVIFNSIPGRLDSGGLRLGDLAVAAGRKFWSFYGVRMYQVYQP
jgi:hypothetical protein